MANKKPKQVSIQLRRDSAANWEAKNPVLLDGEEILVYTSTGDVRRKVGDGIAHYQELPFDDERINSALAQKQNKLTGTQGQIVGFDSGGNASAQQVLADDVYFLDGDSVVEKVDAKQDKLSGTAGQIVGFGADGAAVARNMPTAAELGAEPSGNAYLAQVNAEASAKTALSAHDQSKLAHGALIPQQEVITLTAEGWSNKAQTAYVQGILKAYGSQSVTVAPADRSSRDAWTKAGIWCNLPREDNNLPFVCDTVPTEPVYVLVQWQVARMNEGDIIEFYIDDVEQQADEGSTWICWINDPLYNDYDTQYDYYPAWDYVGWNAVDQTEDEHLVDSKGNDVSGDDIIHAGEHYRMFYPSDETP